MTGSAALFAIGAIGAGASIEAVGDVWRSIDWATRCTILAWTHITIAIH